MNSIERSARWLKYRCGLKDSSALTALARPYYNRFLEAVYGRRGLVRVMESQERIRICPSQRYFRDGFEAGLFDYLRRTVKEGDVILEVGANVGIFTVILARWVGLSGHVYAFEPTPEASATLQRHLALNQVEDRVTILSEAISDAPGHAAFYVEGTSGENTLSDRHGRIPSADRIEVPVTTIDTFCRDRSIVPTLIKIDIEGYEFHALRGALGVISQYSPGIVVELHPMNWPDIGVSSEYARQFISGLKYRQMALDGKSDPFSRYGHLLLERFGQADHMAEGMPVIPVESSAEPPGREVLEG